MEKAPVVDTISPAESDSQVSHEDVDDYVYKEGYWWNKPHLLKLNIAVFLITLCSTNNGYDGSMLNGLQSLPIWHKAMGNPTGHTLGALSNGTIFGSILSLPVAPYINDTFGRRKGIFFGQSINLLGAILQGLSTNYAFFLASRIVLGFGSAIAVNGAPPLISEIAYPSHRTVATALYNTCWYVGAVIAAWVTYGTRVLDTSYCWRIPSYLQGFIPFVQLLLIFILPESPRWYISKGRLDKAEKVLSRIHTGYGTDAKSKGLVAFEMKEIQAALELEKLTTQTSYVDFIKLKNFRKRLFLTLYTPCLMQLSGNGLVSYYLNKVLNSIGITDLTKQLEINGCLMVYNMVLAMSAAAIVRFFKRRTLLLTSLGAMFVCYVLWTVLSGLAASRDYPKPLSNGVLAFIFLYYAAYDIGMSGLPVLYMTEILPYSHRAKGMNIFALGQTITLIYNGYVNPIAMDAIDWKYYIVWSCYLLVEFIVVYFFYPETRGYTLEEVAKVFGDDINDTMVMAEVKFKKEKVAHIENV